MKKKLLTTLLIAAMTLSLAACGAKEETTEETESTEETVAEDDLTPITIAITADIVPMTDRAEAALEEMGYKMDITVFEDYVMPNQALMEDSFDCNFMQHEPYMQDFNASHDGDLVMVTPKILYTPFVLCSNEIESLDAIPEGASVAIPDSPSIREHALKSLNSSGLITLADAPKDAYYSGADIIENPLNLTFVEVDLWASEAMMDECDLVCTGTDQFDMNGVDVTKALWRETPETGEFYAWGIAVRPGKENEEWVKVLNDAFHSDAMRDSLNEDFPGVYEFVD